MIPVGYLVLMAGDEFHRTVLGDDDRKAFRVLATEAIHRTMSGSGALHGLKDTMLRFDIESTVNHFVFKAGDLNFNAKSQDREFVIEQKATID